MGLAVLIHTTQNTQKPLYPVICPKSAGVNFSGGTLSESVHRMDSVPPEKSCDKQAEHARCSPGTFFNIKAKIGHLGTPSSKIDVKCKNRSFEFYGSPF